jgi:hypothetical protein
VDRVESQHLLFFAGDEEYQIDCSGVPRVGDYVKITGVTYHVYKVVWRAEVDGHGEFKTCYPQVYLDR